MKLQLKAVINKNSFAKKVEEFLIGMFCFVFIILITGLFLNICDMLIFKRFAFSFLTTIKEKQAEGLKDISVFFIVLIGPFMEELIFRLPLVLKRRNIQISLCFLTLYYVGDKITKMSLGNYLTWIKIIPILLVILFGKHFILERHLILIKKTYFKIYFLTLSIVFGLLHIINFYTVIPNNLLIFAPLFILPHIILGGFIGYLRIKNNFFIGLLFHCFYNLIVALVFIKHN